MARRYQERRVFSQPQVEVYRAAERAIVEAALAIKPGATEFEIHAGRGINAGSWGERVKFLVATWPGGGTQVIIESKLALGFMDYGKNRRNVEDLFSSMEVVLGPGNVTDL